MTERACKNCECWFPDGKIWPVPPAPRMQCDTDPDDWCEFFCPRSEEPRGCALPGCCAAVETIESLRSKLAAEKERADRAEALARVHKNIASTWKERFEKLLDKAGTYCGIRHSAGDSHEHTVKAYLELRDFLIKARNEQRATPSQKGGSG